MAAAANYLELQIDIFDRTKQRAQVLPDLRAPDLVSAILAEFAEELDYLSADPGAYRLRKERETAQLDARQPLGDLVRSGEHLVLEEVEQELPPRTQRPSRAVYLQEGSGLRAFKLHWLPAIVGRHDPELPENALVAVDLNRHAGGSRVSRRHLRLSEDNGEFYVQTASANPASLVRDDGSEVPIPAGARRERLSDGDIIRLDRSQITLKFIVR